MQTCSYEAKLHNQNLSTVTSTIQKRDRIAIPQSDKVFAYDEDSRALRLASELAACHLPVPVPPLPPHS